MAHNNRYNDGDKGTGLNMTDIPGLRYNPYINKKDNGGNSRSNSPAKNYNGGKGAELCEQDIVQLNEAKIRKQITFSNNVGSMGPFIEIDKSRPAPKQPAFSMGSSSYKMQFSPGKKREELPMKLQNNNSMFHSLATSSTQKGLRHMSNENSLGRPNILSNSIDYGKSSKPMAMANPATSRAKQMNFDKYNDHFRFKKNLTSNADRILNKQGVSFAQTPVASTNSKYEDFKKGANNNFSLNNGGTYDLSNQQENYNYNNIGKYNPGQREASPARDDGLMKRPVMQATSGNYNTMNLKRSLGLAPTTNMGVDNSEVSSGLQNRSSARIGQSSSGMGLNDPRYHRVQNYNNYGYDPVTGIRKESPGRVL